LSQGESIMRIRGTGFLDCHQTILKQLASFRQQLLQPTGLEWNRCPAKAGAKKISSRMHSLKICRLEYSLQALMAIIPLGRTRRHRQSDPPSKEGSSQAKSTFLRSTRALSRLGDLKLCLCGGKHSLASPQAINWLVSLKKQQRHRNPEATKEPVTVCKAARILEPARSILLGNMASLVLAKQLKLLD